MLKSCQLRKEKRKSGVVKNTCWGSGEEKGRFWLNKARGSISGPYRYIHKSSVGGLCPVTVGPGCRTCLSGAVDGVWATWLLPAFYRKAVSEHLILVSPDPESHQIKKAASDSFCCSPTCSGYQHLTLYYESSAL